MSVSEQLTRPTHQGYPSSGEAQEASSPEDEPFGPGGDTALRDAVRPTTPRRRPRPLPRPTEEQAARAELRSAAVRPPTLDDAAGSPRQPQDRVPHTGRGADTPRVTALPVLTPGQIAADRAGQGHRAGVPAALTEPVGVTSRRGTPAASPVERPETVAHQVAPATTTIPRGAYPAARVEPARAPRSLLRSLVRGDAAPTAPMRVVDRLTATPFQHLRKFGDGTDRQARRTLNFALRLAETMFHYGADALDVENAIIAVCATYGVENLEVDITNQSVTINYVAETTPTGSLTAAGAHTGGKAGGGGSTAEGAPAFAGTPGTTGEVRGARNPRTGEDPWGDSTTSSHTVMRVVRSWTDNYAGLADSHQLVTRIIEGEMPLRRAEKELAEINARPKPYPRWMVSAATVVAAGTLALALGASLVGALVAVGSAAVVQLVTAKLSAWRIPEFFSLAANAFVVTMLAIVVSAVGVELSPPRVIAGGLIMLLPTTRMVSTMQDAINGFPVTAAGRLLSTALAFLGIVAGIALGVTVTVNGAGAPPIDVSQSSFTPTGVVTNIAFMLVSTVLISLTMQVKPRHIPALLAAAFVGLLLYHGVTALGAGSRLATGMGAVSSGCVAALLAARAKIPQAVLAIPAMTFLLPGLTLFRGMYAITVESDAASAGITEMLNAMASIVLLAAGVVLAKYLMRPFIEQMQHLSQRRNRRR
ncbi:threonine/serine exporter ThrE family protein [Kocuria sp.]|uniref:threonine/serine ThrE exporter family protein n=1 Tax=Kocuria sp. TaxID=1871328 RepID=UPI0026DBA86B|nr:threonine/serine exporter family protein [Kocuria sp.]MDO4919287.1 threonine/serine exporter family protein [Kocuria sp.]